MNTNEKLTQLQQAIVDKVKELELAKQALLVFEASPERNTFDSLDEAESVISKRLENEAHEDCEGSYNYGSPTYEQEFIVQGKHYLATMTFEYNRHDKTYYYIDSSEYSFVEL